MTSKTAIERLVKELRWEELRDGLADKPSLITVRDKRGRNWLHRACGVDVSRRSSTAVDDSINVAKVLLAKGLDINYPAFTEGNFKATPLWYAIAFGKNVKLATFLLKQGSDPNHCLFAAAYNNDCEAIRLLVKSGAEIDPDVEDATPFLFAIQWSRFEAAEALLKAGSNPNHENAKGMTALHYMLKKRSEKKHVLMVIKYGARLDIRNKEGLTAADIMRRKRDASYRNLALS